MGSSDSKPADEEVQLQKPVDRPDQPPEWTSAGYHNDEQAPLIQKEQHDQIHKKPSQKMDMEDLDEEALESVRELIDFPDIRELVFTQIGMSFAYTCYTLTAWTYLASVRRHLFPDCTKVHGDDALHVYFLSPACEVTTFCFWTFSLCCAMFLLIFYLRDLLRTRLYYELLAHYVFIDFENIQFAQSRSVQLLSVYMLLSLLMYPFSENTRVSDFKSTIPFWMPLLSFIGMVYAQWDLEKRLVSLAKYTEKDFKAAQDHLSKSYHMKDFVFRRAFEFLAEEPEFLHKHNFSTCIKLIMQKAKEMKHEGEIKSDFELGLGGGFFVAFSPRYWVTRMLYQESFQGERQRRFIFWFRIYVVYTYLVLFFLLYLTMVTAVSHLREQNIIEPSEFTRWFRVENFVVAPQATAEPTPAPESSLLLIPLALPG